MKNRLLLRLASLLCCGAAGLSGMVGFGLPASARELIVAIDRAPPYRIVKYTPDGAVYSGIYIDVVREAAKRAGLTLVFEVVPFKRALYLMEHGQADVMLGPNRTDERQKFMHYFGAALPPEPKAIYVSDIAYDIRDFEDLALRSVGVLRGAASYQKLIDIDALSLVEAMDYSTLFRMLDQRRIDALVVPELLAVELIRQEGPYRIRKSGMVLPGQLSFITVARKSDYFISGDFIRFERHLVKMRRDGTFDAIYARYAG